MYSVHQAPSFETNFTMWAWFLPKLAWFILHNGGQLSNKWRAHMSQIRWNWCYSNVKLGSYKVPSRTQWYHFCDDIPNIDCKSQISRRLLWYIRQSVVWMIKRSRSQRSTNSARHEPYSCILSVIRACASHVRFKKNGGALLTRCIFP